MGGLRIVVPVLLLLIKGLDVAVLASLDNVPGDDEWRRTTDESSLERLLGFVNEQPTQGDDDEMMAAQQQRRQARQHLRGNSMTADVATVERERALEALADNLFTRDREEATTRDNFLAFDATASGFGDTLDASNVDSSNEPTPEPSPEDTVENTPGDTEDITLQPTSTPAPTPQDTDDITPEPTPDMTEDDTFSPSTIQPSVSMEPSIQPSISLEPSTTPVPSLSAAPSGEPSQSSMTSNMPSFSAAPSHNMSSPAPSTAEPSVSMEPSIQPSISLEPTNTPVPSSSAVPSEEPSQSSMPSFSAAPSNERSIFPTRNETATRASGIWGDPHVITFDDLRFDCQAYGEFTTVTSLETPEFEIQERFTSVNDRCAQASVSTGFVVQETVASPNAQVSIPRLDASPPPPFINDCPLDIYYDSVKLNNAALQLAPVTLGDVTYSIDDNEIKLDFASGLGLRALVRKSTEFGCFFRVQVILPVNYLDGDTVVGLLGKPNGIRDDDWVDRNGVVLSPPVNTSESLFGKAYDYCTDEWCITDENASLFTYKVEDRETFALLSGCNVDYNNDAEQKVQAELQNPGSQIVSMCCADPDNCSLEEYDCLFDGVCGDIDDARNAIDDQAAILELKDELDPATSGPSPPPTPQGGTPQPTPTSTGVTSQPTLTSTGVTPQPTPTSTGVTSQPTPTSTGVTSQPTPEIGRSRPPTNRRRRRKRRYSLVRNFLRKWRRRHGHGTSSSRSMSSSSRRSKWSGKRKKKVNDEKKWPRKKRARRKRVQKRRRKRTHGAVALQTPKTKQTPPTTIQTANNESKIERLKRRQQRRKKWKERKHQ